MLGFTFKEADGGTNDPKRSDRPIYKKLTEIHDSQIYSCIDLIFTLIEYPIACPPGRCPKRSAEQPIQYYAKQPSLFTDADTRYAANRISG